MDKPTKWQNKEKVKIIYIAGSGRSGSTILSFIIGSAPEVVNGGELHFFNCGDNSLKKHFEFIKDYCSCGKKSSDCPFWRNIENIVDRDSYIYCKAGFIKRLIWYIKILLPYNKFKYTNTIVDDFFLTKEVIREARKKRPSVNCVLDISKSLGRLIYLKTHLCFDLNVIFLVRDGRAFVNSKLRKKTYEKRFLRAMAKWIYSNFLILRYLRKEKISYYHLSYDQFCKQPQKHIIEMNKLFGINIPNNYVSAVANTESHLRAGNPVRLNMKNFEGIKYDDKWRRELPLIKRVVISFFLYPFNKRWVYKDHHN